MRKLCNIICCVMMSELRCTDPNLAGDVGRIRDLAKVSVCSVCYVCMGGCMRACVCVCVCVCV